MSEKKSFSLSCINLEKKVCIAGVFEVILASQTMTFHQEQLYAIQGLSGSGKTTFLHLLAGIDTPTSGAVFLDGVNLSKMSESDQMWYRQRVIGMIFQFHYLVEELTVWENIALPAKIIGMPLVQIEAKVVELISFVGLEHRKNEHPQTLSGGERQRVAIARALMNNPKIILADEPTGSLDLQNAQRVKKLLQEVVRKYKASVIVVTHDTQLFLGAEIVQINL
jgi:lipoprotein-releasing system ATP-binding protein